MSGPDGHRLLTVALFCLLVMLTLAITAWAARRRQGSPEEFYAGGRLFSPLENGFAIAGDYLSAATFLGVAGLIALHGHDGMVYAVGFLAGWLVVLLLVAELVRNCGRFTLADVLAVRLRERPVRLAAGASSVVVSLLYLVAQMVGAGALLALLLGGTSDAVRICAVVGVGALMVVYVACGGMRATTWIQIVKAVALLGCVLGLAGLVLWRYGGNVGAVLDAAARAGGEGGSFLAPGLLGGEGTAARLDVISLGLALVLGTAGLPHILARFYTVPTARAARTSVAWAIGLIGGCCLLVVLLGFAAAAVLGPERLRARDPSGNTALPLLAVDLGGGAGTTGAAVLFAVVAAVAFATVLAVVAGITLAASAAVAHDLYPALRRRRPGGAPGTAAHGEVTAARAAAVGVGAAAIALALPARDLNVALLVGLAFAVAASAHLPVLLYTLFWRRFTTRGAVWAVLGGLVPALVLVALSPVVSGTPQALLPGLDFAVFPLHNPGLVSVPLGFAAGWLGTVTAREPADPDRYAEAEVRALTGAEAV